MWQFKKTIGKQNMRKLFLILLLFIPFIGYSQDLIILRNGEQINCKITKVDGSILYYNFQKGERQLSSYIDKSDIQSYRINEKDGVQPDLSALTSAQYTTVIIDSSKYVKETNRWNNLVTYSQRFGVHAKGWSVQYYGYNLKSTSKWAIPVVFGFEGFEIDTDYFSQFNYLSVNMSYFNAGISPFYKLSDCFFLNLGINLIFGEEALTDYSGREESNSFWGLSPSQGIYFIPKSNVGIVLGASLYEKVLSSEVYKNDIGLKLELGIKF